MVQFFKGSADPRDAGYGALSNALGMGIGEGVNAHFANQALDEVLNDEEFANKPISAKMGKLESALRPYGQTGQKLFQDRMQIEQEVQKENEQEVLGRISAGKDVSEKDYSKLSPQNQFKAQELQHKRQAGKSVKEALKKAGYPDETAEIWEQQMINAPPGGQTDVIKQVNDLIRRSSSGKGRTAGQEKPPQIKPQIEIPGTDLGTLDLDFPELPQSTGLTPADEVRQNEHREKINFPAYNESVDRINALDDEYREVKHLQELNDIPGALPTGLEKWNVDWDTGDLRVKALATPEAQDYVKTIARMARRAKDFFPGRVTNFDLDQFKAGFPTLANSPEGRRIIAQQLALGNRIAYLKDETYKAAMDHYGSNADPHLIKKYAQANYTRLKGQLEEQLKSINSSAQKFIESQPKGRAKVEPGTKLSDNVLDIYLKESNNDPNKAAEMAKEDGYVW